MKQFVVIGTLLSLSLAFPDPSTRIGGGETATIEEFPYMVHIFQYGSPQCGGSIISSTWIVSAGHCLYDVPTSVVIIKAGTNKFLPDDGIKIPAAEIVVHPDLHSGGNDNDIALVRLESPLSFSSTIQPIKLATSDPDAGTIGIVTGWGSTTGNNVYTPSNLLQKLEMPVVGYCGGRAICAGFYSSNASTCNGDSGGPLAVNNELLGIVSAGVNCIGLTKFTDICFYRDWIKSVADV